MNQFSAVLLCSCLRWKGFSTNCSQHGHQTNRIMSKISVKHDKDGDIDKQAVHGLVNTMSRLNCLH